MSALSDLRTGSSLVESLLWDKACEREEWEEAKTSYSYVLHDLQGGVDEVDGVSRLRRRACQDVIPHSKWIERVRVEQDFDVSDI